MGEGEGRVCWGRGERGRPYRILFHANELNLRGTSLAIFNYARFFEDLACGESYIATNYCTSSVEAQPKFEMRFPGRVFSIPTPVRINMADSSVICPANPPPPGISATTTNTHLQHLIRSHSIDAIFTLQENIEIPDFFRVPSPTKILVQGVFSASFKRDQPFDYGQTTYAAISEGIDRSPGIPVVPRIVDYSSSLKTSDDLNAAMRKARASLGIPAASRVFCRHGGEETFDIAWVADAVCKAAFADPMNTVFLFLNTRRFHCSDAGGPVPQNIFFLPGTSDVATRDRFLASCDACIHGRSDGETFGNAIAECAGAGKPVITYSDPTPSKYHLRILRGEWSADGLLPNGSSHALIYLDSRDLLSILTSFNQLPYRGNVAFAERMRGLYARFSPPLVMHDFLRNFKVLSDVIRVSLG